MFPGTAQVYECLKFSPPADKKLWETTFDWGKKGETTSTLIPAQEGQHTPQEGVAMPVTTASEVTENVGEVVRRLKQVAHIPDREIGDFVGLSRNVAQQRMSGLSKWTVGELFLIAEFFGVPVELFYDDPKEATLTAIRDYDVQNLRRRDQRTSASGWTDICAGQAA